MRATILMCAVMLGCAATGSKASKGGPSMSEFTSSTIHVGVVVSDMDKALAFYKDVIGLVELKGFDVSAEMGGTTGLTDKKPFHVHMLKIADTPDATQLKLIQFPDTPGAKTDSAFLHSTLGIRYLTFRVADADATLARAAKAGVNPVGGSFLLPSGLYLTLVRDPDGNMIEIVGPKKK